MQALTSRPATLVRPSTRSVPVALSPTKPRLARCSGVVARDAAEHKQAEAKGADTQPPQPQQKQEYGIQQKQEDGGPQQQQALSKSRSQEEGLQSIRRMGDYISAMQRDMDVLMDAFLTPSFMPEIFFERDPFFRAPLATGDGGGLRKGLKELKEMSWETNETDNEYVLVAHVPGFSKDEIKVTLGGANVLTVQGEHKVVEEKQDGRGRTREQKTFLRTLWLPHNVDTDHIAAKVEHGVLEITVPKKTPQKPESAPKIIAVA